MKFQEAPTEYLPSERSSDEQIRSRREFIKKNVIGNETVRHMFNAIFDIVMIIDANWQAVFANRSLRKFLHVKSTRLLLGLRAGEMFECVHASEGQSGCGTTKFCKICGVYKAIMAAQHGKKEVQECRVIKKDGTAVDLLVDATPIEVQGQAFIIFAIRDISDKKRREMLERVFFHDALNIVGTIFGLAQLLKDCPSEKRDEIGQRIYTSTRRLIDEIEAQRSVTIAEVEDLTAIVRPVESMALVHQAIQLYETHPVAKNKSIVIDQSFENVSLQSDPVLLGRVLSNMLKNALEASKEGDVITIGCRKLAGKMEFSVHNPSSMPTDVQLQIFTRSFSTKSRDRGLGTYGIKLISERYLQGEVSFESSEGKGTTFYARYPLVLQVDEESSEESIDSSIDDLSQL
ncbi:MAG: ATP-binding protein [Pseudomonadota bacterium]